MTYSVFFFFFLETFYKFACHPCGGAILSYVLPNQALFSLLNQVKEGEK